MSDAFTSTGLLTEGYKLTLDHSLPIVSGKVRVTIEPFETSKKMSVQQWQSFISETYGCFADDQIERGDQGYFEVRDVIE